MIVTEFLAKNQTQFIAQPLYRPDLATCDLFLTQISAPGTRLDFIEVIKRNSLKELKVIPIEAYKKCLENWINRWHIYIASKKEPILNVIIQICIKMHKNVIFFNQPELNLNTVCIS